MLCGIPTYWDMWNTYLLEYVEFRPIGICGLPIYLVVLFSLASNVHLLLTKQATLTLGSGLTF